MLRTVYGFGPAIGLFSWLIRCILFASQRLFELLMLEGFFLSKHGTKRDSVLSGSRVVSFGTIIPRAFNS